MDRLDALAGQLSQITMYDIKSYYNQVSFAREKADKNEADPSLDEGKKCCIERQRDGGQGTRSDE